MSRMSRVKEAAISALYEAIQDQRRAYDARRRGSQLELAALKSFFLRQMEFFLGKQLNINLLEDIPKKKQKETERLLAKYEPKLIQGQLKAISQVLVSGSDGSVYFGSHNFPVAKLKKALHGNKCRGLYIRFCELHGVNSAVDRWQLVSSAKGALRLVSALVVGVFGEQQRPVQTATANPLVNAKLLRQVEKALSDYNARPIKGLEVIEKIRFLQELQNYLTRNGASPYTAPTFLHQMHQMVQAAHNIKGRETIFEEIAAGVAMLADGQEIKFGRQVFNMVQFGQVLHGTVCMDIIKQAVTLAQQVAATVATYRP